MKQFLYKNNRIRIIFHIIYFILAILYNMKSLLDVDWFVYLKVIPLVIMIGLLIPFRTLPYRKLVILGLVFGLAGDLILQHGGDQLFSIGAGTFLINQVCYNLYFLSILANGQREMLFKRRYIAFIITVVMISLSSVNLSTSFTTDPSKEKDKILVMVLPIYAVFLNFTAIFPFIINLSQRTFRWNLIGLIIGGVSFFISDNVLGRQKVTGENIFEKRMYDSMLIMGTYYLAQYLIPLSAMFEGDKNPKEEEEASLMQSQIE